MQGHTDRVQVVTFSPDGQIITSASDDHTVRIWNVSTGECLFVLAGHKRWAESIAFSRDRKILASGSHDRSVRSLGC